MNRRSGNFERMIAFSNPMTHTIGSMSDANSEDQAQKLKDAIFAGQKIEAIKLYWEQNGLGLKESKEAVEKLEADLRRSSPDRFAASPAKGCVSVIAVAGIFVAWRILA
jgi:ribosomal protein L7/L12